MELGIVKQCLCALFQPLVRRRARVAAVVAMNLLAGSPVAAAATISPYSPQQTYAPTLGAHDVPLSFDSPFPWSPFKRIFATCMREWSLLRHLVAEQDVGEVPRCVSYVGSTLLAVFCFAKTVSLDRGTGEDVLLSDLEYLAAVLKLMESDFMRCCQQYINGAQATDDELREQIFVQQLFKRVDALLVSMYG